MNSRPKSSNFPITNLRNWSNGCLRRIGRGGTDRSSLTQPLASWIFWCRRRSRRERRGSSRTCETSHNPPFLGLLCASSAICPERRSTQFRSSERKHFTSVPTLQKGQNSLERRSGQIAED